MIKYPLYIIHSDCACIILNIDKDKMSLLLPNGKIFYGNLAQNNPPFKASLQVMKKIFTINQIIIWKTLLKYNPDTILVYDKIKDLFNNGMSFAKPSSSEIAAVVEMIKLKRKKLKNSDKVQPIKKKVSAYPSKELPLVQCGKLSGPKKIKRRKLLRVMGASATTP